MFSNSIYSNKDYFWPLTTRVHTKYRHWACLGFIMFESQEISPPLKTNSTNINSEELLLKSRITNVQHCALLNWRQTCNSYSVVPFLPNRHVQTNTTYTGLCRLKIRTHNGKVHGFFWIKYYISSVTLQMSCHFKTCIYGLAFSIWFLRQLKD